METIPNNREIAARGLSRHTQNGSRNPRLTLDQDHKRQAMVSPAKYAKGPIMLVSKCGFHIDLYRFDTLLGAFQQTDQRDQLCSKIGPPSLK